MKKVFTLLMGLACTIGVFSQAPEKMSYQAVVRNASGELVRSSPVGMKISILQGSATGTPIYVETQNPVTNANGLVTLEIGGGIVVTGTFSGVNWSTGAYFIKTETDPSGGTSYTIIGTSQLLSVPYALYAKTTSDVDGLKQQIKILEDNLIAAGTYRLYDIDGNQYNVVKIGTQVWMKENLRVTRFNDGTPIPLVTNDADWNSLITPAYCWYNNDISNKDIYGALYNGHAIITGILDKFADTPNTYNVAKDKLCPIGWHVPSHGDYLILSAPYKLIDTDLSGMYGYGLMESGTSHWVSGLGTNESGFTALPGGCNNGTFSGIGTEEVYWTSDIDYGHGGQMWYFPVPVDHEWSRIISQSLNPPKYGYSVRCLKDN